MDLINSYKTFLDNGKTERECVTTALAMAQAKGFRPIGDYKELKAGDRVLHDKYAGTEIKDGGEDYLIVNAQDILAIIK